MIGASEYRASKGLLDLGITERGSSDIAGATNGLAGVAKAELRSNQLVHGEVSSTIEARPHTGSITLAPGAEGAQDVTS